MPAIQLSGSISLRLYPHNELAAPAIVEELQRQARAAVDVGFDGVMLSEHHGGFSLYLPNPLQMAGFVLDAMPTGWAGPCPMLLPLKPVAQVAEDAAWLAARFPGRIVVGVAPGSLTDDFEAMEVPHEERMPRYRRQLGPLVAMLSGRAGSLEGRVAELAASDRAVAYCEQDPIPVLSAAMSVPASKRAAHLGAGILFDSLSTPEHLRTVADAYRSAGGTGAAILNRRVWIGEPPRSMIDAQVDVYKSYAATNAVAAWGDDELVSSNDPEKMASSLATAMEASGADAMNLRIHSAGMQPAEIHPQIERLGHEILPRLRARIGNTSAK